MKKFSFFIIAVVFLLPLQVGASNAIVRQYAGTICGEMTTSQNATVDNPDRMLSINWVAPFVRFDQKERMTIKAEVLSSNSYSNIPLDTVASQLEAAERVLWTRNQLGKNLQVFTGTPVVGNLILRMQISYMTGQNQSYSSSNSGSSADNRYGGYSRNNNDSSSETKQESYINLHVDLIRKGSGDQEDLIVSAPDIQAFESGLIRADNSRSNNYSSNSTGCGRTIFGTKRHPYSCSDYDSGQWGWSNDGRLLEAKTITRLAQYLASGAHALICQQIKADQALSADNVDVINSTVDKK